MNAAVSGIVGLVFGVLAAWAVLVRRAQSLRERTFNVEKELAVRESQLAVATESLDQLKTEHDAAIENMEVTFENMSNRVLAHTVEQFNRSQEQVLKERDSKLDLTLKPLETLLDDYKRNLDDYNKEHTGALSDVKNRAAELLDAQQKTQEETRRLNQLLGRGDQRGRWGEIQLENVMQASNLRRGIDYELQVTGKDDDGKSKRPDCVVIMPNDGRIAIDAKFPFDAFEAAIATDDVEQRRALFQSHAAALRKHVKTLKDKSYWEVIAPAPEFVVCFVPSDFAITAALEADHDLHQYATKERVLICGPTNLLSLLWSVAFVLRQHEAKINAMEILALAEKIVDRIRLVAEPIARMGRSLDDAVDSYNKMVKSVESRLIVSAHEIRRLGGGHRAKDLPELDSQRETTMALNEERWGVGPGNPVPEGVSEILDLEAFDEE